MSLTGFAAGFSEAVERFCDDSVNDDIVLNAAKESFAENSLGVGERNRRKVEYDEFRMCVVRLKAIC
jgi:hypothetical protein